MPGGRGLPWRPAWLRPGYGAIFGMPLPGPACPDAAAEARKPPRRRQPPCAPRWLPPTSSGMRLLSTPSSMVQTWSTIAMGCSEMTSTSASLATSSLVASAIGAARWNTRWFQPRPAYRHVNAALGRVAVRAGRRAGGGAGGGWPAPARAGRATPEAGGQGHQSFGRVPLIYYCTPSVASLLASRMNEGRPLLAKLIT